MQTALATGSDRDTPRTAVGAAAPSDPARRSLARPSPARRPRARRLALLASLVAHGGLVAGAATLSAERPHAVRDEAIAVALIHEPPPPEVTEPVAEPQPAEAPAAPPAPSRDRTAAPRPRAAPRPAATVVEAADTPTTQPAAAAEPLTAPADAEPARDDDGDDAPGLPAGPATGNTTTAPAAGGAGTFRGGGPGNGAVASGQSGGSGGGGRPLAANERRTLLARYLERIGPRIHEQFRYPPQAQPLELEGRVTVLFAVDSRGNLLKARALGECPHDMLCEDATRTIRASAPFPPPPPELGGVVELSVPLKYTLE